MLIESLHVEKGDWIVQNTANGAVGKTVAMFAAARGINVINLVRRDAGVDELKAFGIGNGVSTAQGGWQDQVRALAGSTYRARDRLGRRESGRRSIGPACRKWRVGPVRLHDRRTVGNFQW